MATDVLPFGGQEGGVGGVAPGPWDHQVTEALLDLVEAFFVLPQRVVGVHAQHRKHQGSLRGTRKASMGAG